MIYHVLNRANGKLRLFRSDEDYLAFFRVLRLAHERTPVPIFGWCVMPNHWHFVVRPNEDGDLSRFFGYLSLTHATRWQVAHAAVGTGHVYQARFKSFMIQQDEHLQWVLRYVERNPLRANAVKRAQDWRWSSLYTSLHPANEHRDLLSESPTPRGARWLHDVNRPQTDAEVAAVQNALKRGTPLGEDTWIKRIASQHNLQSTLRPRGRQQGWRKAATNP